MRAPPFNEYLGTRLVRMEAGEAEFALDLLPHHTNNRGVAHGGVVLSLLDSAMGAAVISDIPKEWWCATTGLSVQFIAGPREGTLLAKGKVVRRGRSVAFVRGEAREASGRLVATAQGTWHLWPHRPETEKAATEPYVVMQGTGDRIRVGKILAVGRNYAEHIAEMGNAPTVPPVLFLKPPSALVHDGGVVVLPAGMGQVHHEVDLVVAIGKAGRAIPEAAALDHVLGYAVGLDLTLRDVQNEAKRKGEPWDLAKGFDGSAPVSHVVPKDAVPDAGALALSLTVNGATRQQGSTGQMLHGVAALISYASRWITLERGDLLFTGTPSGVGPLAPGDAVVARLSDLATLSITIAAGSVTAPARAARFGIAAVLAGFAIAGVLRLNGFSLLEPDSPEYLFGARSLGSFQGYREIDRPGAPLHTFRPPGISLLLAPLSWLAPYPVVPAKLVVLASALAAVFLAMRLAARSVDTGYAAAAGVLIATSPYALLHATEIATEFPFLACSIAAILLMTEGDARPSPRRLALLAALLAFLPLMRTIGIALVGAALVWCVLDKSRRALWPAPAAGIAVTALWMARNAAAGGPTYFGAIAADFARLGASAFVSKTVDAAAYYAVRFLDVLLPGVRSGRPLYERMTVGGAPDLDGLYGLGLLAGLAMVALAGYGLRLRWKREGRLVALYAAAFFVVLAIYPPRHERLTWPLVPLVWAFVPAGLAALARPARIAALCVMAALACWQSAASFAMVKDNLAWASGGDRFYAEQVPPIYFADYRAAGTWLRDNAPRSARVLTRHSDVGFTSGLLQDGIRFEEVSPQAWRSRIAALRARYLVVPASLYGKFFPFDVLTSDPAYSYAVRYKDKDVAVIEVAPNRSGRISVDGPASSEAAAACVRAADAEPGRVDLATRCAELLSGLGRDDEAITRLEALTARRGPDVRVQVALGQIHLDAGQADRAAAAFRAAASLPEAGLLEQTIARGIAAAERRAAGDDRPLDRARANLEAFRFSDAKIELDRLLAERPDDPAVLAVAAELHTRMGSYDQALALYQRAGGRAAQRGAQLADALAIEAQLGSAPPPVIVRAAGFWAGDGAPGRALEILERAQSIHRDQEIAARLADLRRFYGLD